MTRSRIDPVGDLRGALAELADDLAEQLDRILVDARTAGVDPYALRTPAGDYVLAQILAARAQTLAALVQLGLPS